MLPLALIVCHAKLPVCMEVRLWRPAGELLEVALAVAPKRPVDELRALDDSLFRRAVLEESVSRSLARWLTELRAGELVEQPASADGLTMILATTSGGDTARRVVIGSPRGSAATVLGLLVHAVAWQTKLLGRGERPVIDAVKAELLESDKSRVTKRYVSTAPVRFRARSLGIEGLEVGVDAQGPFASDGLCREALHPDVHLRTISMVEALVATRTTRMGAGECLFELEFEGTWIEVRCPEAGGEPVLAKLPMAAGAVRSLFFLAGALAEEDDAQRARDLSAWTTTLPWVSRPIRTDDLFVRFFMHDLRFRPGAVWYRVDAHGTITRADGSSADDEGRPVMPHHVSADDMETIRVALAACDAYGVGKNPNVTPRERVPDDDSFIELTVQRPSDRASGGVESMTAAWAYGRMAQYDRGPEMEGGLQRVYALYQALMKIRGPADIR